ncbi:MULTISPECIES: peptidoglycan DD-metalloendopeptidase family protein [Treponema]|uniref:peptidoglycan DD-metalloendopeptidase family protein n=1 Tax=Treponema TaxID=157 RepID=UPI003FD7B531
MKFKNIAFADFKKKIFSIKTLACFSVAVASFCVVLTVGLFLQPEEQEENGQGGLEIPGLPVVTESEVALVEEENLNLSEVCYTSYRVHSGDMISVIASNFGITEDTIISVNNIRSSRLLQIGTYLKIPSIPGILYTVRKDGETALSIAEKYKIDNAKLCAVNKVSESDSLSAGTMLFLPDAHLDWVTRQEINGDLFKKPVHARWYMSSAFGWRKSPFTGVRSYHSGVDMACPQGTRIYAAMDGKVTSTGFNNTYGNYVIVTHHSGYKTLYGHMSAIAAVKNQYVTQNSVIGYVGSTGLSTGPHLHFTVFKNGKQINPQNLWN